jgi:hypothetical protein
VRLVKKRILLGIAMAPIQRRVFLVPRSGIILCKSLKIFDLTIVLVREERHEFSFSINRHEMRLRCCRPYSAHVPVYSIKRSSALTSRSSKGIKKVPYFVILLIRSHEYEYIS